ncbi:hypothetical protein M9H77_15417 [Catharanthus roseus]|uniref:Uncharacterized protein n=1 Tax=Catharanthus roseus TaxID=4058 RepID=A0ACC0AZI8_CATRO|nr:hypothetical protein M9H77_15417 [Catharanthus roseus]
MATTSNSISAFSVYKAISPPLSSSHRTRRPLLSLPLHNATRLAVSHSPTNNLPIFQRLPRTRNLSCSVAAAEEETLAPEGEESSTASPPTDQTVSVAVSPSDILTMFFQAEGTMTETAIPTVTQALEEIEGISDLSVKVLEGIASVELTKQTTVQATGVASNLVEIIQSKGFKLQALNLSFQDEEDLS